MTYKRSVFLFLLGVLVVLNAGCAGRATARDSARRLQASVELYERHLETFTAKQTEYYKSRKEELEGSRKELAEGEVGRLQIALASQAAEEMIANPATQARPTKLTDFLKKAHEQQSDLAAKLQEAQSNDSKELEGKIAALEAKRELAAKIRLNLATIAGDSTLADQASDIKDYGTAVKAEIDKLKKEKVTATHE